MPLRPLVFVSGLTLGDYLLWNWSLNGNLDAVALVAGLTLPPLAVACAWLLALSVARLLAMTAKRPAHVRRLSGRTSGRAPMPATDPQDATVAAASTSAQSRKIAA